MYGVIPGGTPPLNFLIFSDFFLKKNDERYDMFNVIHPIETCVLYIYLYKLYMTHIYI